MADFANNREFHGKQENPWGPDSKCSWGSTPHWSYFQFTIGKLIKSLSGSFASLWGLRSAKYCWGAGATRQRAASSCVLGGGGGVLFWIPKSELNEIPSNLSGTSNEIPLWFVRISVHPINILSNLHRDPKWLLNSFEIPQGSHMLQVFSHLLASRFLQNLIPDGYNLIIAIVIKSYLDHI